MTSRIEALVLARAFVTKGPARAPALVKPLLRFGPPALTAAQWEQQLRDVASELAARGELADRGALARHIGRHAAKTWPQLADKILPALALGVAADDSKTHARLAGRDGWAAAIAGRVLGIWTTGTPLAIGPLCDAYAWRQLGLPGAAKRCPPEIRALFVQRYLHGDPASPERQVRLVAATAAGAPRSELRALLDGLVRVWLAGKVIRAPLGDVADAARADDRGEVAGFASAVLDAAGAAGTARFGERKAFISSVWDQLRKAPRWGALGLEDFKTQLVAAHRAGELVLARADLVAAMDPVLVAASEITTDGASFHFVVRESGS